MGKELRKQRMKKELKERQIDVVSIKDTDTGLRAEIEFHGTKEQLEKMMPEQYYIDTVSSSRGPVHAIVRHESQP